MFLIVINLVQFNRTRFFKWSHFPFKFFNIILHLIGNVSSQMPDPALFFTENYKVLIISECIPTWYLHLTPGGNMTNVYNNNIFWNVRPNQGLTFQCKILYCSRFGNSNWVLSFSILFWMILFGSNLISFLYKSRQETIKTNPKNKNKIKVFCRNGWRYEI